MRRGILLGCSQPVPANRAYSASEPSFDTASSPNTTNAAASYTRIHNDNTRAQTPSLAHRTRAVCSLAPRATALAHQPGLCRSIRRPLCKTYWSCPHCTALHRTHTLTLALSLEPTPRRVNTSNLHLDHTSRWSCLPDGRSNASISLILRDM